MNKTRGITLIEILIAISILGIITSITVLSRDSINHYELSRVTNGLTSYLEKARTQSVYSKNGSKYSVKLFSTRAVMFPGTSYTEGGVSNEEFSFGNKVRLATTSLSISTSTITFDRITGKTLNSGQIKLWLSSATTSSSTIIVGKTGIIDIK